MLIIFSIILTGVFILTGVLIMMSPGKPEPFLDKNGNYMAGCISEKVFVNINGVEQGMFIMSKDSTKPVLLFLHGGMPVYFFHGIYDYTVSYVLARDYFEKLKAPLKGFYTFGQSAHSPIFEQPGIASQIFKNDILKGMNNLAG